MGHMRSKSVRALHIGLLIAAGAVFPVGTARADVSETPVATACPAGMELLSVAWFEATGPYPGPRRVDSIGNNNGYVCARPFPYVVGENFCEQGAPGPFCDLAVLGLSIYLIFDDDNPAQTVPAERDLLSGAEESAAPFVLVVPGQLVDLHRPRGDTERAWVQAQIIVHPDGRDGAAQMDGAILVVTAGDGPMPQTSPDAEWLRVDIESGTVESGLIIFAGTGVLRDRGGSVTSFEARGYARQSAGDESLILCDILGDNVYDGAMFEAKGFGFVTMSNE